MSNSIIEVEGLTKIYRTYRKEQGLWGAIKGLAKRRYDEVRAVDGVSFRIEDGEFVGFLGPNGAGKTTVLKMLSGLLYPTSGRARVLGFQPWERKNEMKQQFSLLMGQKNALWWDLPARESLELNRAIYGIDPAKFRRIVGDLSELLEVTEKMNVMVRELSLGERMKMELIAALLHSPRVLFLDEPTIGLDVVSQKKVREFLRSYNAERPIVTMLTSHYMQDIEELCARVIVIDQGRIFYDGPLEKIVDRFATEKLLGLEFAERDAARHFEGMGTVVEQTDLTVKLRVPRAEVAAVCRRVLDAYSVIDINVQEVPIEEVISQLFGQERERRAEESKEAAGAGAGAVH
jgi:ABC-2 type transport system ATP-binding protein